MPLDGGKCIILKSKKYYKKLFAQIIFALVSHNVLNIEIMENYETFLFHRHFNSHTVGEKGISSVYIDLNIKTTGRLTR